MTATTAGLTISPVMAAQGRGPRQVSLCTAVRARAEDLFAILANPHRHHEVDGSGTVRGEANGPTSLSLGDRFTVLMESYKIPYRITSTITRIVSGRLIEWQHPAMHKWRWQFDPQPDGHTLVTETFDYADAPGAPVYELVGIPAPNRRGIHASLELLTARFAAWQPVRSPSFEKG